MARGITPFRPKPATKEDPLAGSKKDLEKEANSRLAECKKQKAEFVEDIREGYFFAAPHRRRQMQNAGAHPEGVPKETGETATSIACELSSDFVGVVLDAFMPQAAAWAERRPGVFIPDDIKKIVSDETKKQDAAIFEAMRASNLYAELPKAMNPDCALGTFALWIDDPNPAMNMVVQAVPLRELEVNLGPFGEIDDRWVLRQTKFRYVKALLPDVKNLPADLEDKINKQPEKACVVKWGYWRIWSERGTETWQEVRMVDQVLVDEQVLKGEGCCPLLPIRFNPSPDWAFGDGPLSQGLPDLRSLDDLEAGKLEYVDAIIRPATTIPDESAAAFSQGIENGKAYPIRAGTEAAIKRIYEPSPVDAVIFATEELSTRLKRLFFQDWPTQTGDTPPTATQWLDEMVMAQRRLGMPGMSFFLEGPSKIFLRFKWLLEKRGVITPITVDGKSVSLQPYNPAQAAAEQQEVQMVTRALQLFASLFPEEYKAMVDGRKTMQEIAAKMRVTGLLKFRSEADQQAAVALIAQLMGGGAGGQKALAPPPGAGA